MSRPCLKLSSYWLWFRSGTSLKAVRLQFIWTRSINQVAIETYHWCYCGGCRNLVPRVSHFPPWWQDERPWERKLNLQSSISFMRIYNWFLLHKFKIKKMDWTQKHNVRHQDKISLPIWPSFIKQGKHRSLYDAKVPLQFLLIDLGYRWFNACTSFSTRLQACGINKSGILSAYTKAKKRAYHK